MDKIKKITGKFIEITKKEKIAKFIPFVIFGLILGTQFINISKNIHLLQSLSMFDNEQLNVMNMLEDPSLQLLLSALTALIYWGIFEGVTGMFFNMFSQRSMIVGSKFNFKSIVRMFYMLICALQLAFTLLIFIPTVGPYLVNSGAKTLQMLLYTIFFTLAYIALEDNAIIRANIGVAYFPLQRMYKIYYGISVVFSLIDTVSSWNSGDMTAFDKTMFFVFILIYGAYFAFVNMFFMKFLSERQKEALEVRAKSLNSEMSIKETLEEMGIELGESYSIYTPEEDSNEDSSDNIIIVEPEDIDDDFD